MWYKCVLVVDVGGSGCLPGQFLCGDGKCVDRSAICNGYYDCIDAADERDCSEFHFIAHSETLNNVFELNPFTLDIALINHPIPTIIFSLLLYLIINFLICECILINVYIVYEDGTK